MHLLSACPRGTGARLFLALLAAAICWLAPANEGRAQTTTPSRVPTLGEAPRTLHAATAGPVHQRRQTASVYGDASYGFTLNTDLREQVRIFYHTVEQASQGVPSGWNGSVLDNDPGATTPEFQTAVALRVNYFRAMAGIPAAVTLSPTYDAADQQAALMMSANQQLSHSPPNSWLDYTASGADAASHSNLALGIRGPDAIRGYIEDYGTTNDGCGHRRWLLYPPTTLMGTGDVDASAGGYRAANALWVTGANAANPPASRDGFVAWPPPGYVPCQLVYPRWSFSFAGADFSSATVTMTRGGNPVAVQLETVHTGYGDDTLVWVTDGLDPGGYYPNGVPFTGEAITQVTVNNVKVGGQTRSFSYHVIAFDPTVPASDTVLPTLVGPAQMDAGTTASFGISAVPGATGYRVESDFFAEDIPADAGAFDFTPPDVGVYTLRVTPLFYGGYPDPALASVPLSVQVGAPVPAVAAVTARAAIPQATVGDGSVGQFVLTRSGDLSGPLTVAFTLAGSAVNGVDYAYLRTARTFPPGRAKIRLNVVPIGDPGDGTAASQARLLLQPGDGYAPAAPRRAVVTILR